jgi:hypothetical protein
MYQKPKIKKQDNPMQQAIMDRMQKVAQYRPAMGQRPVPLVQGQEPKPGATVPDFEPAQQELNEGLYNNPEFLKFQQALFAMMNKGKK